MPSKQSITSVPVSCRAARICVPVKTLLQGMTTLEAAPTTTPFNQVLLAELPFLYNVTVRLAVPVLARDKHVP